MDVNHYDASGALQGKLPPYPAGKAIASGAEPGKGGTPPVPTPHADAGPIKPPTGVPAVNPKLKSAAGTPAQKKAALAKLRSLKNPLPSKRKK